MPAPRDPLPGPPHGLFPAADSGGTPSQSLVSTLLALSVSGRVKRCPRLPVAPRAEVRPWRGTAAQTRSPLAGSPETTVSTCGSEAFGAAAHCGQSGPGCSAEFGSRRGRGERSLCAEGGLGHPARPTFSLMLTPAPLASRGTAARPRLHRPCLHAPTRMRLDPSSSICSWCKLLMFSILLILLLTKKSFFSRVNLSTPSMFLSRLKEISRTLEQAKHLLFNEHRRHGTQPITDF